MSEPTPGRVQSDALTIVAQVLHDHRHDADGYSCPARGTTPHPYDRALAEKIVAALENAHV